MSSTEISDLTRQYWQSGGSDDVAGRLITGALARFPDDPVVAGRCWDVMEQRASDFPLLRSRIDMFGERLARVRELCRHLDVLADPDTDPAAIFGVLGDGAEQIRIDAFDPDQLRRARNGASDRASAAAALLAAFGWEQTPHEFRDEARILLDSWSARARRFQSHALFTSRLGSGDAGLLLGFTVKLNHTGDVEPSGVDCDGDLSRAVEIALDLVDRGAKWGLEWSPKVEGSSIALAAYVAACIEEKRLRVDPFMAATGELDLRGNVLAVSGIREKLAAAYAAGMRRVILPAENEREARAHARDLHLEFVSHTSEVLARLQNVTASAEVGFDARRRMARALLPTIGLEIIEDRALPNGHQFKVTDGRSTAGLVVYTGAKGRIRAEGGDGSAKEALEGLIRERLISTAAASVESERFFVPPARRDALRRLLIEAGGVEEEPGEHEALRFRLERRGLTVRVTLYSSGKCVISSGPAPAFAAARDVVVQALEGLVGVEITDEPAVRSLDALPPGPHIGTDEAGKGDFFGPLVSAAVFVDSALEERLLELGVKDSKRLSNAAVRKLASSMREIAKGRFAVTRIGPKRFNQLYEEMRREGKNLNTLLAWGHTRSIEDLLAQGNRPDYAVVDKFADARFIEQKLLGRTRSQQLTIHQFPKAESVTAVAAASILARDNFLAWFEERRTKIGIDLPRGAGPAVVEAGRAIVAEHGIERLSMLAKMSFRTVDKVLAP